MIAPLGWDWLGVALQIIGAASLAARILRPLICYIVMMIGALILIYTNLIKEDFPQMILQFAFTQINIIGILKWRSA